MTLQIIFILSGLAIIVLISAKMWQDRQQKPVVLLRGIGLGDEHVRALSRRAVEHYSNAKEKSDFFLKKQLPLHTKNFINKTNTALKEKSERYIGNIRGSRFLKKSDGLSEFFRNISEKENSGRIDDVFEDRDNSL